MLFIPSWLALRSDATVECKIVQNIDGGVGRHDVDLSLWDHHSIEQYIVMNIYTACYSDDAWK